ncbi:lysophospholipase [Ornithinimicrobium ciconiae]|uniref:Lysophospholipase n=1 Tax=Ornithinimicrobium ciconiae TaxID=2594265 RepID=A0A516G945_9MICO|nr:alpha/beta hydrolase [Ornithinimicrobium ciconiae]QDO88056.1 lysophospholipase [Ornithinimicrobium ciconiae]
MSDASTIALPVRDRDVRATLRVPAPTPSGVVLFVHGSGDGSADGFADYADRLAALRVASLVVDKIMDGYGQFRRNYDQLASDTIDALSWIRHHYEVPVALLGYSEGSWVSILAATRRPDLIDRLILCSAPLVPPRQQTAHHWSNIANSNPSLLQRWLARVRYGLGWSMLSATDYGRTDIVTSLEDIRSPVRLVLGQDDPTIDVPEAVAAFHRHRPYDEPPLLVPHAAHFLPPSGDWLALIASFIGQK